MKWGIEPCQEWCRASQADALWLILVTFYLFGCADDDAEVASGIDGFRYTDARVMTSPLAPRESGPVLSN